MAAAGDQTRAQATAYGFLTVLSLFCVLPFFWVFLSSLDPDAGQFLAVAEEV